jgi:OCT family organic cation transporter-like MFS transporter 4/5
MLDSEDRFTDINVIFGFIFALLGRATISGCLSTWYLWIAELYPTAVRGNAIGICACIEAIAGILSPLLLGLSVFATWLPSALSGTLAVFGGLICLLLPETFGKPMVMNLEQAVQLYRSL